MPGLVPGIHVVTRHDRFRTSTLLRGGGWRGSLGLTLNLPAWIPGTSPGMTDTALINNGKS